jgi:uncharacterized protein
MNFHKTFLAIAIPILSVLAVTPAPAWADRTQELRAKFEERFPKLKQLKKTGKIGETFSGGVEAVKGDLDADAKKLVDEENADRIELYALIAKNENTTPQLVAERNAARNFERAASGEFLKGKDGQWHNKK